MEISPSVRDFRSRVARFVEPTLFRSRALFLYGDKRALPVDCMAGSDCAESDRVLLWSFRRFTRLKFLRRVMPAQMVGGVTCPPKNRPAEM